MDISKKNILFFQKTIFSRYAMHKRHLPRRDSFDPYKVFVSEIMLQQTQVSRVVPKFLDFIQDIPTFSALATCDIKVLLSLRS